MNPLPLLCRLYHRAVRAYYVARIDRIQEARRRAVAEHIGLLEYLGDQEETAFTRAAAAGRRAWAQDWRVRG